MGGKNHQPCNQYLRHSTVMSRHLSKVVVSVEQANIVLEDVILAELDGTAGDLGPSLQNLDNAQASTSEFMRSVLHLRQSMDENRYSDLPVRHAVDFDQIGETFVEQGLVDAQSWDRVSGRFQQGTFRDVLDMFEEGADGIFAMITDLRARLSLLSQEVQGGNVCRTIEENGTANIKVEFATLYSTLWRFNLDFLASSMLSTELWYQTIGVGGVTTPQTKIRQGVA